MAAFLAILAIQYVASQAQQVADIPYSQFQQLLRDGKVAEVGISDRFIQGTLKEPLPGGETRFATTRVEPGVRRGAGPATASATRAGSRAPCCATSSPCVLPILLFVGVWFFLGRRHGRRARAG